MTDNKDLFDSLLEWLDPDREKAAQRYEVIRAGLIRLFVSNGINDAEHFADVVIDRVATKLPEIRATYVGDPAKYFHGVARNVLREARRQKEIPTDTLPPPEPEPDRSEVSECLSKCLKQLAPDKQEFILDYHLFKGHEKIENHRQMAIELLISEGALRTRAHHVRASLEKCVLACIGEDDKNKSAVQSHR